MENYHIFSPAHIDIIILQTGSSLVARRRPERAGPVDEEPEQQGSWYSAQQPDLDPLDAQRKGTLVFADTSVEEKTLIF